MDLRNQVKSVLRQCGHAAGSTIHDRLNGIESTLQQIIEQNTHTARTQTALLQSAVDLVENAARKEDLQTLKAELAETASAHTAPSQLAADQAAPFQVLQERIERLSDGLRSALSAQNKQQGDSVPQADIVTALEKVLEGLARLENRIGWVLENEVPRQICLETNEYEFTNPETGLLSFLYSYLPARVVLDIGASRGNVSEPLLKAGYEVYAFEPEPTTYASLVCRLGGCKGFHASPFALGSREGEMALHMATDLSTDRRYEDPSVYSSLIPHSMPADLPFTSTKGVAVKTLAGLHADGTLPQYVGLVKIDTEGYDLEVIRGMEQHRYPVIAAEFWDSAIPFGGQGQSYTLESLVDEMRAREYFWHIVLYRIWGKNQAGFYCNHVRSLPESWGNVVFFRDRSLFAHAQEWCSATLPLTYFKAAQA